MDKICIRKLEVFAFHGVYEEEMRLGQKFYVTAELEMDTRAAGTTDDLRNSVNYGDVCHELIKRMQNRRFKLIEAVAEDLAGYLLMHYPVVRRVVLELEKPGAPVPYSLDTVMVHIERERHRVYLSLGSNLGDRRMNLATAVRLLAARPDIWVKRQSPLYETLPYGYTEQPTFLNGCLELETLLLPEELLTVIHEIEQEMGRTRDIHWGPRTLDLDIIFYDQCIIDTEELHIPHADMVNREFVLRPLSDIAGFMRHPILNVTVDELLKQLLNQTERE